MAVSSGLNLNRDFLFGLPVRGQFTPGLLATAGFLGLAGQEDVKKSIFKFAASSALKKSLWDAL
jgi:hypothetical protein